MKRARKKTVAVNGQWLPVPLEFLRSSACASLSPHAAKLLLDVLGSLGPNAIRNGDISLAHGVLDRRGWSSRSTLLAAVRELMDCGLLVKSRQGGRLDCSLFACTLYPLDSASPLEINQNAYTTRDWAGPRGELAQKPETATPVVWRRARKSKTVAPPRDDMPKKRPATGRNHAGMMKK
jgi:hypothetical protein